MKFLGLISILIFSSLTLASSIPDFPFVTVTGESVRQIEPDKVNLKFSVVTFHKEANEAKSMLMNTSKQVIDILKANGVQEKNILSFDVEKVVKRKRDDNYNYLGVVGYDFTQSFEISLNQLEYYAALSDALLDMNYVYQLDATFDYSKRKEIEVELIKEAGSHAKQKAMYMAESLGVKIDSVYAFNDTTSYQDLTAMFGLTEKKGNSYIRRRVVPPAQVVFMPQFIEIFKSIHVVYKIKI